MRVDTQLCSRSPPRASVGRWANQLDFAGESSPDFGLESAVPDRLVVVLVDVVLRGAVIYSTVDCCCCCCCCCDCDGSNEFLHSTESSGELRSIV